MPLLPTFRPTSPELLAMAPLALLERLLLGYFLDRVRRSAQPGGAAPPLALRLAAHPAGQELFMESFVGLAHLNGSYGQVLVEYLRHKHTAEAQLFGHGALFLKELLASDEPAWRVRPRHLRALPGGTHAFPRSRLAFAEVVVAWHDADFAGVPAALLLRLLAEAAVADLLQLFSGGLPLFCGRSLVPDQPV